jgi:hypothetical protein
MGPSAPLCPSCQKHPADPAWRPFCSRRCKLLDLARWADGTYRIPGKRVPAPPEADEDETGRHKK